MKSELERIIDLQPEWSHLKTPLMDERGLLVRREGPAWLRTISLELSESMGIPIQELIIEGRDGTGPKTEVPWFRFADRRRSPSATEDWYCVFLFDTRGEGVYLSLGQGSTTWTGVDFRPRPARELNRLASWGRQQIEESISMRTDLVNEISLHSRRSPLGPAYEAGIVIAKHYVRGNIAEDDQLREDVLFFADLLGQVYSATSQEQVPGGPVPEVVDAIESADRSAGKSYRRPAAGGFRLNAKQRAAIELQGMAKATDHLASLGFTDIKDTSKSKPYDLTCTGPNGDLFVEVKGTTSHGESVILTKGEVDHHQEVYPSNALIVVSEIVLSGDTLDEANGGNVRMQSPWSIDSGDLTVISYTYKTNISVEEDSQIEFRTDVLD